MPYDVMTVTVKGAQTFAQLAGDANAHLIIDGCDSDAIVKTQEQAVVVENRPSSSIISTTTHIVLSGVTNNSFLVYAQFEAGQTAGGQVNSFYLYGHLQSAPNTKFVIAVASDSRPTKLPDTQDIINYVEVRFSLTFTPIQNSAQVSIPSDEPYILRSEYLRDLSDLETSLTTKITTLEDRSVTTHAEGQPTTGENQTVYGVKTFKNDVFFDDAYRTHIVKSNGVTRFRLDNNPTSTKKSPCLQLQYEESNGECNIASAELLTLLRSSSSDSNSKFEIKFNGNSNPIKNYARMETNDNSTVIGSYSRVTTTAGKVEIEVSNYTHTGKLTQEVDKTTVNTDFIIDNQNTNIKNKPKLYTQRISTIFPSKVLKSGGVSYSYGKLEGDALVLESEVDLNNINLYGSNTVIEDESQTFSWTSIPDTEKIMGTYPVNSFYLVDSIGYPILAPSGAYSTLVFKTKYTNLSEELIETFGTDNLELIGTQISATDITTGKVQLYDSYSNIGYSVTEAFRGTAPAPVITLTSTYSSNDNISTLLFGGVYQDGKTKIKCNYIECDEISGTIRTYHIYPKDSSSDIGALDNMFDDLYIKYINVGTSTGGYIYPVENNKTSIGSTNKRFKDLYLDGNIGSSTYKVNEINATTVNATTVNATTVNATTLNGVLPYPSPHPSISRLIVPIGTIILISIARDSSLSTAWPELVPGDEVYVNKTITRASRSVTITSIHGAGFSTGFSYNLIGTGNPFDSDSYVFRLLSGATGNTTTSLVFALAIRIS